MVLPNSKLPVYLSFAWWQDLPQWENGPYTAPDIAVSTNFAAYASNLDPVLDKALTFDGSGYVRDPMAYLQGLFMEKKFALLETEAPRLVNDPLYAHVPFESEINRAGFSLLDGDQVQGAIYVLELCTKLFPESSYSWYSLGEAYYKAADMAKAKEAYGKSMAIDPKGTYGKYAAEKLEEIKGK